MFRPILIWSLAILFYLYEFFVAMIPATISVNVIHDMHLSAQQFAMSGSAYFFTYSLMQIPVGILYDRYGVRLFLTIACGICSIGLFGFSAANSFLSCAISRMLIGFGASFGFISLLILALNWFPQKHFAFLAGFGQMLGTAGPLLAGAPIVYLMQRMQNDWRQIFFYVALFGILQTLLIALFVRTRPNNSREVKEAAPLFQNLRQLLRIPQIWLTMFYAGTVYVSLPLLGAFWGPLYLQTRGFSKASSAFLISMIWIGLAIGSPLLGKLSDQFQRRKPYLLGAALLGALASLALLYLPTQNKPLFALLFFLLGVASGGQCLSFANVTDNAPEELQGIAVGANNSMIGLFGALFPLLMTIYTRGHFEIGFLLMPIAYGMAFLITLTGIRETFCRPQPALYDFNAKDLA